MAEPATLTPEQQKEIIDWLAVGEFKTVEDFKKNHNTKYLTGEDVLKSEPVKKHIGNITGSIRNEVYKTFKSAGVEIKDSEVSDEDSKNIRPEQIVVFGLKKLQDLNNGIQEDLKKQIGNSTDERIKKLTDTYEKLNTDYQTVTKMNAEFKTAIEEKDKALEIEKKSAEGKIKEFVKNEKEKSLFDSFTWADEANDFVKAGFKAQINDEAIFSLNDKDELEVRNRKTNEQFANPTKNGVFLSPDEYLRAKGIEANKTAAIYKINPDGGRKQDDNSWWKKNIDKDKKQDDTKKPLLAVNVNKNNLPSTAKM